MKADAVGFERRSREKVNRTWQIALVLQGVPGATPTGSIAAKPGPPLIQPNGVGGAPSQGSDVFRKNHFDLAVGIRSFRTNDS